MTDKEGPRYKIEVPKSERETWQEYHDMEKKPNQRIRIYLQQALNREHITVDDWKDYLEAYKTHKRTTHAFFEELMECGVSTNCDCEVKQKWITKVVDWYHEENDGETGTDSQTSESADGDTSEDGGSPSGVEPCVEEAKQVKDQQEEEKQQQEDWKKKFAVDGGVLHAGFAGSFSRTVVDCLNKSMQDSVLTPGAQKKLREKFCSELVESVDYQKLVAKATIPEWQVDAASDDPFEKEVPSP